MKRWLVITGIVLGVLVLAAVGVWFAVDRALQTDPFMALYAENCAVCHGESFEGASQGPALVGGDLVHGDTVDEIATSIARGFPGLGMPPWAGTLDEGQIRSLAILIAERRVDRLFTDMKMFKPLVIPTQPFATESARFHLEVVTEGLAKKPFSIAPLPDGSLLVTEKLEGLSIVHPDGSRSDHITGTPATGTSGVEVVGLDYGLGWLLDVAPHPDYAENGWIYLLHTEICEDCEQGNAIAPATMTRLIRGRITDGAWTDEEVIWSVPHRFYSSIPDIGAGGRLAFDRAGHVYLSIGMKGGYFEAIQDLSTPYGKIHRVYDDGRIPEDNPFVGRPDAMASTWTYGHRSPQGLEFDPRTGNLWGSEMGPRGGDEVNLLLPGRNYGWPLYSLGVDYDGTPVEYWKDLGIEYDLEDIEQPVVDLTPSPAVSSFVIYRGDAFPGWEGDFIVGSLKATELYRFEIDGDEFKHRERLIGDLARVRDVEVGPDGLVYLLLEHDTGSQIVRLVPEDDEGASSLSRR
ncbi:MAG TPA: PQQ-dependent sugar dehydrogenase [Pseudomonadales bacterium]